jgi:hypothetical protein
MQRETDHDRAEVERADLRRVDYRQTIRCAVVWARQVNLPALDAEGIPTEPDAERSFPRSGTQGNTSLRPLPLSDLSTLPKR